MTNRIAACFKIANEAHAGQRRWDGSPYMSHVASVYSNVIKAVMVDKLILMNDYEFELAQCVALLHDVIEDCMPETDLVAELVLSIGTGEFTNDLMRILADELTHSRTVSYTDYVANITSRVGLLVKYCDLQHNMSCSMENILNNHDVKRASKQLNKYGAPLKHIVTQLMK